MKTLRALFKLIGCITLASVSGIVSAGNCSSNLRGAWQTYGGFFNPDVPFPLYYDCTYTADPSGELVIGSSFCDVRFVGDNPPADIIDLPAAGQLVTDSECNVTGFLDLVQANVQILHAKMNNKGDTITGVQTITLTGGPTPLSETSEFTMIKISNN